MIGSKIRDELFGAERALGKWIRIGDRRFRVIGIMEEQGGSFMGGPNFDRQIYIPITSYVKAYGGHRGRQGVDVAVKAPSKEALDELETLDIGGLLDRRLQKFLDMGIFEEAGYSPSVPPDPAARS